MEFKNELGTRSVGQAKQNHSSATSLLKETYLILKTIDVLRAIGVIVKFRHGISTHQLYGRIRVAVIWVQSVVEHCFIRKAALTVDSGRWRTHWA